MPEVQIGQHHYLIGRLNARQQMHIVKRLAPVIQGLLPIWTLLQTRQRDEEAMPVAEIGMHAAVALSQTIGSLSDTDSDYVMDMCLSVVKFRSDMGNWAPLRVGNGTGQVMLDEADDLAVQMRLLWEVLHANLGNFSLETLLPTSLHQSLMDLPVSHLSN
jgi:hypothetical protein